MVHQRGRTHYQFESIHLFPDGNGRIWNVLYLTRVGLLEIPVLYLDRPAACGFVAKQRSGRSNYSGNTDLVRLFIELSPIPVPLRHRLRRRELMTQQPAKRALRQHPREHEQDPRVGAD